MGWAVFSSVFVQVILIFLFQIILLEILYWRIWYSPINPLGDNLVNNHTNSTLIKHVGFYFMTYVIVFSKGSPWRRPLWCNWGLSACIIIVTAVNIWLLFNPGRVIGDYLMFVNLPTWWEGILLGAAILHFILAYAIEQLNPFFALFVDYMNLKFYNWY